MGVRSDQHEWTSEENERLKSLWGKMSSREIGLLMGMTKGSIIGKADRLKLRTLSTVTKVLRADRGRDSSPNKQPSRWLHPRKVKPMQTFEPEMKLITIIELTDTTCHWPVGDPSDLDSFRYCGCIKVPGPQPYCPHHMEKSMKSFEAIFCNAA